MPPENITNDQDQVPPNPLTDDLTVLALSDLSVSKAFAPSTVAPNGISTLTITLQNTNTSPLINVSVTDNLPGTNANNTVRVAPVPNASTTCGAGVITADPWLANHLDDKRHSPGAGRRCAGHLHDQCKCPGEQWHRNRTNTILPENVSGTVQGDHGDQSHPGRFCHARVRDLSIGLVKGFNPLTVFGGSASTMSVQLINPNTTQLSGITFTDNMPSGMFLATPSTSRLGPVAGRSAATRETALSRSVVAA
jgi:uncharacterized repeat protein (TIGR01451 family)